jgi:hypothetical protein
VSTPGLCVTPFQPQEDNPDPAAAVIAGAAASVVTPSFARALASSLIASAQQWTDYTSLRELHAMVRQIASLPVAADETKVPTAPPFSSC